MDRYFDIRNPNEEHEAIIRVQGDESNHSLSLLDLTNHYFFFDTGTGYNMISLSPKKPSSPAVGKIIWNRNFLSTVENPLHFSICQITKEEAEKIRKEISGLV